MTIIRVNSWRHDASGHLIATVLEERGGSKDLRLGPEDAERVVRAWTGSQFDLERYARLPIEFPAPDAIPVEVSDAAVA